MKLISLYIIFQIFFNFNAFASQNSISLDSFTKNSNNKVVFMRHALAPGYGDPINFNVLDCKTQRNLNETGIDQSKSIGNFLKNNGIRFTKIFSSFWCRCKDTAFFLNMGNFEMHNGLNSFFQGHVNKEETLSELNKLINNLNLYNGPYLMVTHYVVIQAFTGISLPSGGMAVYDLKTKKVYKLEIDN
jgi:phosphohistidine phosphatase SixA